MADVKAGEVVEAVKVDVKEVEVSVEDRVKALESRVEAIEERVVGAFKHIGHDIRSIF